MTITLLQYNNYFNRIIKREESIEDYIRDRNFYYLQYVNFNPSNGITTKHIIDWEQDWTPDYCVIVNEQNQIVSRWFIIDSVRTRGQQYRITLRRDVIADFKENIINAPTFIERGYVKVDNPLIFNKEDFNCNEIKVNEISLCDKWKNVGWYAIFYDKKLDSDNDVNNPLIGNFSTVDPQEVNAIELSIASTDLPGLLKQSVYSQYLVICKPAITEANIDWIITRNGKFSTFQKSLDLTLGLVHNPLSYTFVADDIINALNVNNTLNGLLDDFVGDESDIIAKWNGNIIKTSDNHYYRVAMQQQGAYVNKSTQASGPLLTELINRFAPGGVLLPQFTGTINHTFWVKEQYVNYVVSYDEIVEYSGTYDLRAVTGKKTTNASYGVALVPFVNPAIKPYPLADATFDTTTEVGYYIPNNIINEVLRKAATATSSIYDVQILPYCPVEIPVSDNDADITAIDTSYYTYITDSDSNNVLFVIHPDNIQFTRDLDSYQILASETSLERKVNNQCTFYRLCSPNFNGTFEFSAERNLGVQMFNIDVTLKPYQSYIHINPVFNGLYGRDYNDARGLICGGDFSLTRTVDAWETYKLQNKNYENIFGRQIQNMDTMRNYDRVGDILGAFTGSIGAASSGAITGAMLGNPVVGAVAGGASSLAGGIADIFMNEGRYQENRSYVTDVHNYQLGNIKALPTSLGRVDSLNNNFKIFPVLEEYTCTDEEKAIFRDKIKYEGMTVNAVGYISSFLDPQNLTFVRGQLIRGEIDEDSHILMNIYDELSKGVYF